jgi:hypothetical protein
VSRSCRQATAKQTTQNNLDFKYPMLLSRDTVQLHLIKVGVNLDSVPARTAVPTRICLLLLGSLHQFLLSLQEMQLRGTAIPPCLPAACRQTVTVDKQNGLRVTSHAAFRGFWMRFSYMASVCMKVTS